MMQVDVLVSSQHSSWECHFKASLPASPSFSDTYIPVEGGHNRDPTPGGISAYYPVSRGSVFPVGAALQLYKSKPPAGAELKCQA